MYEKRLNIKHWAEEDRPREKLLLQGRSSLTNSELVAILIRSGNQNESAVRLAKKILESSGNDLNKLGKLSLNELTQIKGIGSAKALSIIAALELGRRRTDSESQQATIIKSSKDVFHKVKHLLFDLSHEEFWVIYLDRKNAIIKSIQLSKGGITGTLVDIKIIFKYAIEFLASSIILCHNHPSGNLSPSKADVILTEKIKEIAGLMDTKVLDHLIIGEKEYFSFADEGIM